jgi:hypothetical protein
MTMLVDMAGKVVNGIVVIERMGVRAGKPAWLCKCHCGSEFQASGTNIRLGTVRECPRCAKTRRTIAATKHGGVTSREYMSWFAMKSRCNCPGNKRYSRYGGRGISVCERWLNSFENFYADMGPMPTPEHTLERIDLNSGYAPENCRWATRIEQANNRSNNTRIEIDGRIQTLTQWSEETGVHRTVIHRRMKRGLSGSALISKGIQK